MMSQMERGGVTPRADYMEPHWLGLEQSSSYKTGLKLPYSVCTNFTRTNEVKCLPCKREDPEFRSLAGRSNARFSRGPTIPAVMRLSGGDS